MKFKEVYAFLDTLPVPTKKKHWLLLVFHRSCGASKDFMKTLKAFIKLLEAPKRSVKII